MMDILWWNRLVNSVRFLEDIQDVLLSDESVQLVFEDEIPWKETMLETLEQRLSDKTDSKSFDILDVSEVKSPGKYLMERYCSQDERKKYWPTTHGSPECFLAQNEDIVLNNRYVCITGISSGYADKWISSIGEYLSNCEGRESHGVFILLVEKSATVASKYLKLFGYNDYVSDYDCMMLCLTIISSFSCSRAEKMYICEVASNIADNRVEHAGLLAARGCDLIKDPISVAKEVYNENGIVCSSIDEKVKMAVWEAQIKLVFPRLESFRAEIIRKYEKKLQQYLPIRSSNNDIIEKPSDLEIGQLFYICKENRTDRITDVSEYEMLKKMREARNTLAHWEAISYDQMKALNIL